MTPMKQAVNDWLSAQADLHDLATAAWADLHTNLPRHDEQWAQCVRTRQRECRRCGTTLVALYPAANDEDGRGPMSA